MQSEILNAKDPAFANDDRDATTKMIFEGAMRELKFRQAAVISHRVTVTDDNTYLESTVDVFARGRTFVLIAFFLFLLVVFVAIFQSTDNWSDRIEQFKPIVLVIVFAVPLGYVYLNIEKKIRHHRLHKKLETKLQEFILVNPNN